MFRIMRMILKILVHIKKVERMPELCQVSFPRNAKNFSKCLILWVNQVLGQEVSYFFSF